MSRPHVHSAAAHRQARSDFSAKRRATIVGALVNLPLALIKIVVGVIGHSQSLIADGVHSAADLISDAVVLGYEQLEQQLSSAAGKRQLWQQLQALG